MTRVVERSGAFNRPPRTKAELAAALAEIDAAIDRRERGRSLQDEADELSRNLKLFIRRAWPIVEPRATYRHNWHIDVICDHLERVTKGDIRKLQIWIPPGTMKSRCVSIFWPAWEWTHSPHLRYYGGSYHLKLSKDLAGRSRDLITSEWYQDRWGHLFRMKKTDEGYFTNDVGGTRLATAPNSTGTGMHGHRILIDDAVNANEVTEGNLAAANDWYSGPLATRGLEGYAEVIIMQRLHENDLAAHALTYQTDEWTVLCLPEVYEKDHPYAWQGDPRMEGELLWKNRIDEKEHEVRVTKLGRHRAAGQLQQRPAAKEGEILKRTGWDYYNPDILKAAYEGDVTGFPKFRRILVDADTSFKEKTTSDYVAIGVWGVHGSRRYLLRTFHERAGLSKTKAMLLEARTWAMQRWKRTTLHIVIEKKANGVEIIEQLQKQIPGVTAYTISTDKTERAEACEPDFDSKCVLLPGGWNAARDDYDPAVTPAWAQDVVEQCASFPNASHDDLVDMVTMALNWSRMKGGVARISSPADVLIDTRARGRVTERSLSDRVISLRGR